MAMLAIFLFVLPQAEASQLNPGERLEYTFSYRGILSGFTRIDIAHAEFVIQQEVETLEGREIYQASLNLTTEPFRVAEILYPIRYHYRSWLEPDKQTPLLVMEYLATDEISEELIWFDHANQQGYRYVKKELASQAEEATPPVHLLHKLGIGQSDYSRMVKSHQSSFSQDEVWDYLSMLYRLRFMPLQPGQITELPLYNGKRIKHYRVKVAREHLQWDGWNRSAFRLNLNEVRNGNQRADSITSVWVSDDEARLPLRFYVKRTFGTVEGMLQTGRPIAGEEVGLSRYSSEVSNLARPPGLSSFDSSIR